MFPFPSGGDGRGPPRPQPPGLERASQGFLNQQGLQGQGQLRPLRHLPPVPTQAQAQLPFLQLQPEETGPVAVENAIRILMQNGVPADVLSAVVSNVPLYQQQQQQQQSVQASALAAVLQQAAANGTSVDQLTRVLQGALPPALLGASQGQLGQFVGNQGQVHQNQPYYRQNMGQRRQNAPPGLGPPIQTPTRARLPPGLNSFYGSTQPLDPFPYIPPQNQQQGVRHHNGGHGLLAAARQGGPRYSQSRPGPRMPFQPPPQQRMPPPGFQLDQLPNNDVFSGFGRVDTGPGVQRQASGQQMIGVASQNVQQVQAQAQPTPSAELHRFKPTFDRYGKYRAFLGTGKAADGTYRPAVRPQQQKREPSEPRGEMFPRPRPPPHFPGCPATPAPAVPMVPLPDHVVRACEKIAEARSKEEAEKGLTEFLNNGDDPGTGSIFYGSTKVHDDEKVTMYLSPSVPYAEVPPNLQQLRHVFTDKNLGKDPEQEREGSYGRERSKSPGRSSKKRDAVGKKKRRGTSEKKERKSYRERRKPKSRRSRRSSSEREESPPRRHNYELYKPAKGSFNFKSVPDDTDDDGIGNIKLVRAGSYSRLWKFDPKTGKRDKSREPPREHESEQEPEEDSPFEQEDDPGTESSIRSSSRSSRGGYEDSRSSYNEEDEYDEEEEESEEEDQEEEEEAVTVASKESKEKKDAVDQAAAKVPDNKPKISSALTARPLHEIPEFKPRNFVPPPPPTPVQPVMHAPGNYNQLIPQPQPQPMAYDQWYQHQPQPYDGNQAAAQWPMEHQYPAVHYDPNYAPQEVVPYEQAAYGEWVANGGYLDPTYDPTFPYGLPEEILSDPEAWLEWCESNPEYLEAWTFDPLPEEPELASVAAEPSKSREKSESPDRVRVPIIITPPPGDPREAPATTYKKRKRFPLVIVDPDEAAGGPTGRNSRENETVQNWRAVRAAARFRAYIDTQRIEKKEPRKPIANEVVVMMRHYRIPEREHVDDSPFINYFLFKHMLGLSSYTCELVEELRLILDSYDDEPSIANATNIDTLLNATEKEDKTVAVPPEVIQEKISFIFNNLSQLNLNDKSNEMKTIVASEEFWPWVAQYLVMKRASIEPNFHHLYSNFLDTLKFPKLNKMVLAETYRNIKILLRTSDKGIANFSDRSLLKNLGHWLGMLTLAKNKPILYLDLDLRSLLIEAYMNGQQELLYVVPFVAKILESCNKSRDVIKQVFKPPNPWTMCILNILAELHQEPDLKLNLKFEIEVLCKNLRMEITDLKPSHDLKDLNRVTKLESQLTHPKKGEIGKMPSNVSLAVGGEMESAHVPVTSVPGSAPAASTPPTLQSATGAVSTPPPASAQSAEPKFSYHAINVHNLAFITQNLSLNQQILISLGLNNVNGTTQIKQMLKQAIEKAAQEWLPTFVDRSVKIALSTSEHVVKKDFALDHDEVRMRSAAHQIARQLTGALGWITCREHLTNSVVNNLKISLLAALNITDTATEAQKETVEQSAQIITAENIDNACAFIQKTAMERVIVEIDQRLRNVGYLFF